MRHRQQAAMAPFPNLTKDQIRQLEVENGFRQFDLAQNAIDSFLDPDRPFRLRPSLILNLQQTAVEGIEQNAGRWRTGKAGISSSKHITPGPHLVENLVLEMCEYINENLHEQSAFYLASYIMWRLNWIHPFDDGNGRTSRITSYIVLSVKLGYILPGTPTVPDQITVDRTSYFKALEDADEAEKKGEFDFSTMENMLRGMLAKQLLSVIEQASE